MRARARVLLSLLLAAGAGAPAAAQQDAHATGRAVYDRWCSGCHGAEGRGDGPAAGYMLPRPRDFTRGTYQIKSTPSGELPTDADILRIIDEGMPGTAMPGWREKLSSQQRQALVAYLKSFSPFFETEPAPTRIAPGRARKGPGRAAQARPGAPALEALGLQPAGHSPAAVQPCAGHAGV